MKTAGDYQVMKSSAKELLQAIDSTAAWDWARNEGNRGVLKSTVEALTTGVTEELRVVLTQRPTSRHNNDDLRILTNSS